MMSEKESDKKFADVTDIFDSMIDWTRRLAHEEPFYRQLFGRINARSVVDVACGTGRHAAMFHSWSLQVQGADLSAELIARAKTAFGEPSGLSWAVRGYDQPIDTGGTFDVAICVGNSLALAPDLPTVHLAIEQMLAGIRPGGAVVVHVLNAWSLPHGPCLWQKAVRTTLAEGPALIIKGVHRCGEKAWLEFLAKSLEGDTPLRSHSVPFLALEAADLERAMRRHGASKIGLFGGYRQQPYDRLKSVDIVLVAEK